MTTDVLIVNYGRATPEQMLAAWLDARAKRSVNTLRAYQTISESYRTTLGSLGYDLDSADPRVCAERLPSDATTTQIADAQEYALTIMALTAQAWAGERTPSNATFNLRLAIVSSFYKYTIKQGLLHGYNPIDRVERHHIDPYADVPAFGREMLTRALREIDHGTVAGRRDYTLINVALHTGHRAAELAGMRAEHITSEDGLYFLVFPHCKGDKRMVKRIGMATRVGRVLGAWLTELHPTTPDAAIWPSYSNNASRGSPISAQAIADICAKWLGSSRVHRLRHTFAQAMEQRGAPLSEIQALLGHANIATTGIYLAKLRSGTNTHLDELSALFGLGEDE